jgi:3-hydroxyisobutyrate dehydrogenase-like beta-hydroxyacid dehydrogenase
MSEISIETVGVIGLGKMGGPLARHLVGGGFSVLGYDVAGEAVAAAENAGTVRCNSPADMAGRSDLVIIGVGFDSEVERVFFSDDGVLAGAKPGLVVAVASTIAPRTMKKIAARAADLPVTFLDIPMCRGEQAAIDGKLLIMGGGDVAAFDACRKAFSTFSDAIHHLGAVGAGQVGKMVNNMILWACISANHEGLALAEGLGVEVGPLRDALLQSSAENWALATRASENPMPWAEKDMTIVLKEADDIRLSLPLSGSVKEVIKGIKIALGDPTPKEIE